MSRDFPAPIEASAIGADKTIAIVASVYNTRFVDAMLDAAMEELDILMPDARRPIFRVPGAFEIPVVASYLAGNAKPDAILALGVIIQGATAHAELVGDSVTQALQDIAVSRRIPIIHEVLLVDNEEQAEARTMGREINRGIEAARATVNMVELFHKLETVFPRSSATDRDPA
jgi:6,7-dimethyl-8-ribityllumazine synthase